MKRRAPRGFANPEYAILIAVVLIVAVMAIPRAWKVAERDRDLKALGEVRAALTRYEADHNGMPPVFLQDLTQDGKYLREIPSIGIIGVHPPSSAVKIGETADDAGGWIYDNWPGSPRGGEVWINCTHVDSRGSAWSRY